MLKHKFNAFDRLPGWFFAPDDGAGGAGAGNGGGTPGNDQGGTPGDGDQTPENFEAWLEEQPEEVQSLYETHTQGLRSALNTERDSRKDLEKQLRDLAKKAEKGSENETQLTQMADQLAETERQNTFYDAAHDAGVANLKLAWMAAKESGLVRSDGNADFAALKEKYPELFGATTKPPKGNGGDGSRDPNSKADFNTAIRRAAGRIN